jgi:hemolysin type calcium-binding protein
MRHHLGLALGIVLAAAASSGAVCTLSSIPSTCSGYPIDVSQNGGNLTVPSTCDTCPGHCQQDPSIVCDADAGNGNECGGSNTCLFSSATYGKCGCHGTNCTASGRNCNADVQCYGYTSDGSCTDFTHPYGGDGVCTIYYNDFSAGATTINATAGNDLVCIDFAVATATVTVNLAAGDDILNTSAGVLGPLVVNGGDGRDIVNGGSGNDTINGDDGDDILHGNGGNDTIDGGTGNDIITGDAGNDTLTGGPLANSGPDISGDDNISGGSGDDTITGNGGRDVLNGNGDNDTILGTPVSFFGGLPAPDDNVGSLYCGGAGDDRIWATGARHQCIDAGVGQAGTNTYSGHDCTYEFYVLGRGTTPESTDIGTIMNCLSAVCYFGNCENPSAASCNCPQ